jgi:hypothetical protein
MGTSGNDDYFSGGARGDGRDADGHARRSSEQPHPQLTVRCSPDSHGAPREPATAVVQGQPGCTSPTGNTSPTTRMWRWRRGERTLGQAEEAGEVVVGDEEEGQHAQASGARFERRVNEQAEEEDAEEDEDEEEEEEGEDERGKGEGEEEDDANVSAGGGAASVEADAHRSARATDVRWAPGLKKWAAYTMEGGNKKHLGHHPTEEAAARAIDKYVEDGVDPVKRRGVRTSQSKGVSWDKGSRKWKAACKGRSL